MIVALRPGRAHRLIRWELWCAEEDPPLYLIGFFTEQSARNYAARNGWSVITGEQRT